MPTTTTADPRPGTPGAHITRARRGLHPIDLRQPRAADPGAERSITFQPGAAPSVHAAPIIGEALTGRALGSHPQRGAGVRDDAGRLTSRGRAVDSTGRTLV